MGKDKVKIFLDTFCLEQGLKQISVSTIGRVIKDKKINHRRIKVSHFGKIKETRKKKKLKKPSEFHKYFTNYLNEQNTIHYWNYKGQPYKNGHIEKYNRTIQEEFID